MKKLTSKPALLLLVASCLFGYSAFAQALSKTRLTIGLGYYAVNDKVPYLVAQTKAKINGRFKPVGGIALNLYLNDDSANHLIAQVTTSGKGEALAVIPASLQAAWAASAKRTFVASFTGSPEFSAAEGEVTAARAKILLDTTADKKISARLVEWKGNTWLPVKGVDLAITVRRLNAYLTVNPTATFTTDSTGSVQAEFKRDSLPGDSAGNIVIVAKLDDNDIYGNLRQEMTVPWGAAFRAENAFVQRSLFATRNKAPLWLLLMAYSIVAVVWSILVYLVSTIFRIKKEGA